MGKQGRLSIKLLGTFQVALAGAPITGLDSPRLQSLLARLVLSPGTGIERAVLAYELWPESTDAQARGNLRKLLFLLVRRLPDPERLIEHDRHTIRWRSDAPSTIDVTEFTRLTRPDAAAADLERGVALYGGPFLPGCYDDWIVAARETLHNAYVDALGRLAADREQRGQFTEAAGYLEQRVQGAPYDEDAWTKLMQMYAAAGQRGAALAAYARCREALQEELGVEPPAAARELYRRLREAKTSEGNEPPATARPDRRAAGVTVPLIGRDEEQAVLRRWCYHLLQQAGPGLIQITGEAGVGKTRLAEDLARWAADQGAAIVIARAYRPDQETALGPVQQWLQSDLLQAAAATLSPGQLRELAPLVPDLVDDADVADGATMPSAWRRQALFDAMTHVLLAVDEPLLLVADDLHWWDSTSIAWLHHAFARLGHKPLAVVATYRAEEPPLASLDELLAWLQSRGQLHPLELGPLNAADTTRLIAAAGGGAVDPDVAKRLYDETEGNPLFVLAWAQANVTDPGTETAAYERFADRVTGLPAVVHGLIMSRLLALSAEARQVADAAAVLGRGFSWGLMESVSGLAEDALVTALDELCLRRVLQERDDGSYDFAHGRIRDVVEARLSRARRRFLHSRAADALSALHGSGGGPAATQLATHYEQAGRLLEAATQYGHAARQAAAVYANERALTLCQKALAVLQAGRAAAGVSAVAGSWTEAEAALWEGIGDLEYHLGRYAEAAAAFVKALALTPVEAAAQRARLLCKQGNVARERQRYAEALRLYVQAERAIGAVESEPPATATVAEQAIWLDVQLERMRLYYRSADRIEEMLQRAKALLPIVEQHADARRRCRYYQALAVLMERADRFAYTERVLRQTQAFLGAAKQLGNAGLLAEAEFAVGFVLLSSGPDGFERPLDLGAAGGLVTAEDLIEAGLRGAAKTGDLLLQVRALTYLAFVWRFRERIDRVEALSEEALGLSEQAGLTVYTAAALAQQAWVAWRRGDAVAAEQTARAAISRWADGDTAFPFQWSARWPLLAIALASGDLGTACDCAAGMLAPD